MNRRTAIIGGVGVLGAAAIGTYLWREPGKEATSPVATVAKPMLVFVGHEL